MIYVLLPRLKNKKQEIWTIQTHERAIVFTIKANGDVGGNASVRTKEKKQKNEKIETNIISVNHLYFSHQLQFDY